MTLGLRSFNIFTQHLTLESNYRHEETSPDGKRRIIILNKSIDYEYSSENAVRGVIIQGGWIWEEINEETTKVVYVVLVDPKGIIPNWIANYSEEPLVIEKIDHYLKRKIT